MPLREAPICAPESYGCWGLETMAARSIDDLWPCVLLHATHNTFVQGLFDPLTSSTGWAKYTTTEFGAGLALAMVVAATVIVSTGRSGKGFPLPRHEPG